MLKVHAVKEKEADTYRIHFEHDETGEGALAERVREWINTPRGTDPENPEWGNTFKFYKGPPFDINSQVSMEMDTLNLMSADIDGIEIKGINVAEDEINMIIAIASSIKGVET